MPHVQGLLRVLQVHNRHAPGWGGEETVVELEFRLLQKRGHAVEQFQISNAELKQASIFQQMLAVPGMFWSQSSYRKLSKAITRFKPDVIHVHNTFPRFSPSVFWAASRAEVPVIHTLHNFRNTCVNAVLFRDGRPCEDCVGGTFWNGLRHRCYADSFTRSAAVLAMNTLHQKIGTYTATVNTHIALNSFSRDIFVRAGLPPEKLVVKPNFVPVSSFRLVTRPAQIVFAGSMARHKGLHVLLDAWRQVQLEEANLLLVGDGPERFALQKQFQDVLRVSWAGSLPHTEVLQKIRQSRALILPTLVYENCPMVLLEAFAEGTPVIVPDLPSMVSILNNQQGGLMYQAGDAKSLADTLHKMLSAPNGVWSNWSRNASGTHARLYSEATNYRQLISIYETAIKDRGGIVSQTVERDIKEVCESAMPSGVPRS